MAGNVLISYSARAYHAQLEAIQQDNRLLTLA